MNPHLSRKCLCTNSGPRKSFRHTRHRYLQSSTSFARDGGTKHIKLRPWTRPWSSIVSWQWVVWHLCIVVCSLSYPWKSQVFRRDFHGDPGRLRKTPGWSPIVSHQFSALRSLTQPNTILLTRPHHAHTWYLRRTEEDQCTCIILGQWNMWWKEVMNHIAGSRSKVGKGAGSIKEVQGSWLSEVGGHLHLFQASKPTWPSCWCSTGNLPGTSRNQVAAWVRSWQNSWKSRSCTRRSPSGVQPSQKAWTNRSFTWWCSVIVNESCQMVMLLLS